MRMHQSMNSNKKLDLASFYRFLLIATTNLDVVNIVIQLFAFKLSHLISFTNFEVLDEG